MEYVCEAGSTGQEQSMVSHNGFDRRKVTFRHAKPPFCASSVVSCQCAHEGLEHYGGRLGPIPFSVLFARGRFSGVLNFARNLHCARRAFEGWLGGVSPTAWE